MYERIRANPHFKDSTLLYIFENNLGCEHDHLNALIRETPRFNNVDVLYENTTKIGFCTGEKSRLKGVDNLAAFLCNNAIAFEEDLIVCNTEVPKDYNNRNVKEYTKNKLIHQVSELQEYKEDMINGTVKRNVTSLFSHENVRYQNKKDDLERALTTMLLYSMMFRLRQLPVNYEHIASLQSNRSHYNEHLEFLIKTMEMMLTEQMEQNKRVKESALFDLRQMISAY